MVADAAEISIAGVGTSLRSFPRDVSTLKHILPTNVWGFPYETTKSFWVFRH